MQSLIKGLTVINVPSVVVSDSSFPLKSNEINVIIGKRFEN